MTDKLIKAGSRDHIRRLTAANLRQAKLSYTRRFLAIQAGQLTLPDFLQPRTHANDK